MKNNDQEPNKNYIIFLMLLPLILVLIFNLVEITVEIIRAHLYHLFLEVIKGNRCVWARIILIVFPFIFEKYCKIRSYLTKNKQVSFLRIFSKTENSYSVFGFFWFESETLEIIQLSFIKKGIKPVYWGICLKYPKYFFIIKKYFNLTILTIRVIEIILLFAVIIVFFILTK